MIVETYDKKWWTVS